jgi:hypothetical protein
LREVIDSEAYDEFEFEDDRLSEDTDNDLPDPSDGFVVAFDQDDLENDKPLSDPSFDP